MVFCSVCGITYDETCPNEKRNHRRVCNVRNRNKYYHNELSEIENQKRLVEEQLQEQESLLPTRRSKRRLLPSQALDTSIYDTIEPYIANDRDVLPHWKRRKASHTESSNSNHNNPGVIAPSNVQNDSEILLSDSLDIEPSANNETSFENEHEFTNGEEIEDSHGSNDTNISSTDIDPQCMRQMLDKNDGKYIYHPNDEKHCLLLASILNSVKAPLHTYDKILKWFKIIQSQGIDMTSAPSYKSLIRRVTDRRGLSGTFPKTVSLKVPSGNKVNVTKFSFAANLFSLLSNEDLMRPENLIFGNDIFYRVPDHKSDHVFDDVETSEWYLRTQKTYCISIKDVLIPIIIFIDKTQVKSKNTEPISFTLGIFKRHIRRKPIAWRNFGLIPGKLGELENSGAKRVKAKDVSWHRIRDWHYVCEFLMSDFAALQKQKDGLEFELFGNYCRLKIPIMFFIGDIEGHDKLCTRRGAHGGYMNGVTHSCKIEREVCGNPGQTCEYFTAKEIASLQMQTLDNTVNPENKKKAIEKLHKFAFHKNVKNAFFDLDFGDSLGGLHTACGVCLMHTFKQRFPNDIIEFMTQLFGTTTDSAPAHHINRSITRLIPFCSKQSDRSFPTEILGFKISFYNSRYTLSANQKFARLFPLLWYFYTTAGMRFIESKRNEFYQQGHVLAVKKLIELAISLYQCLSQDQIKKSDIPCIRKAIVHFQTVYKDVSMMNKQFIASRPGFGVRKSSASQKFPSKSKTSETNVTSNAYDNPCQFPKFHYLCHVSDQITMFGSSNNFNGDQGESNHKAISKATGIRTQGRNETFDHQTSVRFAESLVLDKSFKSLGFEINSSDFQTKDNVKPSIFSFVEVHKHGSSFSVELSSNGKVVPIWKNESLQYEVDPEVLKYLETSVFKEAIKNKKNGRLQGHKVILKNRSLQCFTTLDFGSHILRAHPCYRNEPWFDYVMVFWEGTNKNGSFTYTCPALLKTFIQIINHPTIADGYYAIIHSTAYDESKQRTSEAAYKKWCDSGRSQLLMVWSFETKLSLVNVKCIKSPCYIFPDFEDQEFKVPSVKFVFQARTLQDWGKVHSMERLTWQNHD